MSSYKNIYITKSEFEARQKQGRQYEGFIEGVGYAWIEAEPAVQNTENGIYPKKWSPYSQSHISIIYTQKLDTSRDMVSLSLRKRFPNGCFIYDIQRGDTLTSIAKKYNVTVEEIVRWNNIVNPSLIQVGQILFIDMTQYKENLIKYLATRPYIPPTDPGTIEPYKPNAFEVVHESWVGQTWVGKILYEVVDDAWITAQCFTIGHAQASHLSGHGTVGQETVNAGIGTLTLLAPIGKIGTGTKVMDAATYNVFNKGTGIYAAKSGGFFIRQSNFSARNMEAFRALYPWFSDSSTAIPYIMEQDSIR